MQAEKSSIMEILGFSSLDIGYFILILGIIVLILLVLVIFLMVKSSKMKKRLDWLTAGAEGASLEEHILTLFEDNRFLKANAEKNKKEIRLLSKRLESAYQKVGLVKYDAFRQMGGQLSFSLCILDDNNNGFIINSVHSTEGCYTYTKEIKMGESDIDLGEEEQEALSIALGE